MKQQANEKKKRQLDKLLKNFEDETADSKRYAIIFNNAFFAAGLLKKPTNYIKKEVNRVAVRIAQETSDHSIKLGMTWDCTVEELKYLRKCFDGLLKRIE